MWAREGEADALMFFHHRTKHVLCQPEFPARFFLRRRERNQRNKVQCDHGTLQQNFIDFIWIVPLPTGWGLGRTKLGRVGRRCCAILS